MACVRAPAATVTSRTAVRAVRVGAAVCRARRSTVSTHRCPTVSIPPMKAAMAATVTPSDSQSKPPLVTTPASVPSMSQPTRSLAMPPATVIWPMLRRISPMSISTRATTGSADTASATAMNSAKTSRESGVPRNSSGSASPRPNPSASGSSRLPVDDSNAGRPRLASSFRSVSKPVTTMSSATPIQATDSSSPDCTGSAGNSQA